ncbi:hypothetical protein C3R19_03700, partial [Blautia producta]
LFFFFLQFIVTRELARGREGDVICIAVCIPRLHFAEIVRLKRTFKSDTDAQSPQSVEIGFIRKQTTSPSLPRASSRPPLSI